MNKKFLLFFLFLMLSCYNSFAFYILSVSIEKDEHENYVFTMSEHMEVKILLTVAQSLKFNTGNNYILVKNGTTTIYEPSESKRSPDNIPSISIRNRTVTVHDITIVAAYEGKIFFFNSWEELDKGISKGGPLYGVIGKVEDDNNKQQNKCGPSPSYCPQSVI